jgi:hypothetical protein
MYRDDRIEEYGYDEKRDHPQPGAWFLLGPHQSDATHEDHPSQDDVVRVGQVVGSGRKEPSRAAYTQEYLEGSPADATVPRLLRL